MSERLDDDVQYIATTQFVRTMLADIGFTDALDVLDDHYDFLADPGMEEGGYKGKVHRSERKFMWERDHNRHLIDADAARLAAGQEDRQTYGGKVPFYLIAMALRRSPQGKRRAILTDDPGLIELLDYYGIETIESDQMLEKMKKDQALDPERAGQLSSRLPSAGDLTNPDRHQPFSEQHYQMKRSEADAIQQQRTQWQSASEISSAEEQHLEPSKKGDLDLDR